MRECISGKSPRKGEVMEKYLYFILEGRLQSWGESSQWKIRDSADWPTKSGIAGMLGSALGYDFDDKRIGELCNSFEIGIKTDDKFYPHLIDFQTADYTGGLLANGQKSKGKPELKKKHYVVNKKYVVVLKGKEELLNEIYDAVIDPVWILTLGSSCCIPSTPITPHIVDGESMMDVLKSIEVFGDKDEIAQLESDYGTRRNDVRLAREGRHYESRYVRNVRIQKESKDRKEK